MKSTKKLLALYDLEGDPFLASVPIEGDGKEAVYSKSKSCRGVV